VGGGRERVEGMDEMVEGEYEEEERKR